ncbi:MAG: YhdP family protein [Rudaea sp.]
MPSTAPASSAIDRLLRFASKAVVLAVGAFCALLLAIRFVAYPQMEAHRDDIARWLGTKIGQPVEIDAIVTGWDGWNPRLSIRGFRVRAPAGDANLLELPRVDLVVAWTSLPRLDLRLKELMIVAPRLSVRRDAEGRLHLAGFDMASESEADDSAFADWLMRQPQVIVRDALVAWNDELRKAPQLILDRVQFRLDQRYGRHQAGLTGVPPPEIAAPIDLRVDVTGGSLKDLPSLAGKLYLRLDYADLGAWREWLPLPFTVDSGKGALRLWVDFAHSQRTSVVADVELADVHAKLADDLAPLALAHVAGRMQWKRSGPRSDLSAQQLSFALPDGTGMAPTDLTLALVAPTNGAPSIGILTFHEVALAPLAEIAAQVPLPRRVREDIARYAPRGTLRDGRFEWTGPIDAPLRYSGKADFEAVAIASRDELPGATHLSGTIDASERGGSARLAAEGATVTMPHVFATPIAFDTLKADIAWRQGNGPTQVQWKEASFANPDLAGSASGAWQAVEGGPGSIVLDAQITRANLASAHRYLPVAAPKAVREWLKRALVKGTSSEGTLTLAGDLALFPFVNGKGGQFRLAFKGLGVAFDYAEGWPPISDIAADFRIDGARFTITAAGGRIDDAQIAATRAEIPDFLDTNPVLRIDGTANGPTPAFLAFVAKSPVAARIGHAADDIEASGDGHLAVRFELPLHEPADTTVAGEYQFASNAVRIPGVPALSAVDGKLEFTEKSVRASDVSAQVFGGPARLAFASEAGATHVSGSGTADVQQVRALYDAPLLDRLYGNTDWQLTLDARDGDIAWSVASSLAGATVDLPTPIGKPPETTVPLRIERRAVSPQQDRIAVDYGSIAKARVLRRIGAHPAIDRALVLVGDAANPPAEPQSPGVWIRANVDSISVDDWLAVDLPTASPGADGSADAAAINGIDLQAANVVALGRTFTNLQTTARRQSGDWRLTLDGADLAGTATWRSATAAEPNGRILARLARLAPPPSTEADGSGSGAEPSAASHWPAVDLVADTLIRKGRPVGKLEFLARPSGGDWQVQKLALVNDAGRIDAKGWWRNATGRSQTRLDVAIDVKEAGAFLGRFGWPDAVKAAPTKIDGQVAWAGSPSDFDYRSLSGNLAVQAGAGQFTKLEPGVGRLLGVLSLQALPRRISLDFRDVFSEGFAFDTVKGDVRIDNGVMHTDDFRLVGPAAAVNIAGDIDLARETQQLKVRVQPSLSSGVSAGAAALFIANPLLGAAVGAGTLLAQKILNNPFDQLFSYEYAVSGSWDDPVVTRLGAQAASSAPPAASIR